MLDISLYWMLKVSQGSGEKWLMCRINNFGLVRSCKHLFFTGKSYAFLMAFLLGSHRVHSTGIRAPETRHSPVASAYNIIHHLRRPACFLRLCHDPPRSSWRHRHAVVHLLLESGGDRAFRSGVFPHIRRGIAETAIGKSAPWSFSASCCSPKRFVQCISRAAACSCRRCLPRGSRSHGCDAGQILSFGLMFDYVLTGPSRLSAGLYLAGLINEIGEYATSRGPRACRIFRGFLAIGVTLYFWRKNIIGIH